MFTGIVQTIGEVAAIERGREPPSLTIRARQVAAMSSPGDSVAVNGVCLTVARPLNGGAFGVDVISATLARTTLGDLRPGDRVNLERALTPIDLLGGHIVAGHVDDTAAVRARWDVAGDHRLTVELPDQLRRYVIARGSITVDGVSLTVADLTRDAFTVALVPATTAATTLGRIQPGDRVNLEVDLLARIVAQQLALPAGAESAACLAAAELAGDEQTGRL
jgi:riboflavin synthase